MTPATADPSNDSNSNLTPATATSNDQSDINLYRFSSKEFHPNSGLVYYPYRVYDANLQRWLKTDQLGEKGFNRLRRAESESLGADYNLYTFLENDPFNSTDPFGLKRLTLEDCNKFKKSALDDIKAAAGEETKACWYRGLLGVVGGGAIASTGGLGLGLGAIFGGGAVATDLYSVGKFVGDKAARAQQINRLYNLCVDRVTAAK